MSIEAELRQQLTEAMKSKDSRTLAVVRMINSKVTERRTAKGFQGEVDDALLLDIIASYRKSLAKAREEFLAAGERGQAQADELQWEIAFCERFLPQRMDVEQIRAAVREAMTATGIHEPKMAGKLVGEVMKQHKGQVEPGEVKKIADEELAKG